jgi:release factor glutamine methyltransferase
MSTTIRQALAQSGLVPIDAQVLLAHALRQARSWLVAHAGDPLPREQAAAFAALAARRRAGEPVAYLTGEREFWGLALSVTPDVLIPRPETETLVELALEWLPVDAPARVLDLGTGSGAIALAIASERRRSTVLAVDRSPAALAVARGNADRHALVNVEFMQSDWYEAVAGHRFDLIASNPPYVALHDAHLDEGDLRFEPAAALASGVDGLGALRVIIERASAHLAPGGSLLVEHGFDQAEAVRQLLVDAGFKGIIARRDLAGIPRIAAGRLD